MQQKNSSAAAAKLSPSDGELMSHVLHGESAKLYRHPPNTNSTINTRRRKAAGSQVHPEAGASPDSADALVHVEHLVTQEDLPQDDAKPNKLIGKLTSDKEQQHSSTYASLPPDAAAANMKMPVAQRQQKTARPQHRLRNIHIARRTNLTNKPESNK